MKKASFYPDAIESVSNKIIMDIPYKKRNDKEAANYECHVGFERPKQVTAI
jgi:hypothetical protein